MNSQVKASDDNFSHLSLDSILPLIGVRNWVVCCSPLSYIILVIERDCAFLTNSSDRFKSKTGGNLI